MKKIVVIVLSLFLSVAYSEPLINTPNQDIENAELVRISNILNAVYPLIDQAEMAQNKNSRVVFNYAALRNDIQLMQSGIAQKINQSVLVPHVVQPLQNDFLTNQTTINNGGLKK